MLFLLLFAVYTAIFKIIPVSDCQSSNYLPWLMLKKHTLSCDYLHPNSSDYMYYPHNGHFYSTFPPGTAFAALPVYLIPSLFIDMALDYNMEVLGKISASVMMALAGVLIFLIAHELSRNRKTAILITAVFAFGTSVFAMASQLLLTFTGSILFLTLGTWFLVKSEDNPKYLYGAGYSYAYAGFCQPVCYLFLVAFGIFILVRYKMKSIRYAVGALPALSFALIYSHIAFGSIFKMGETLIAQFYLNNNSWIHASNVPIGRLFDTPLFSGIANHLFSPGRGLLAFSPILVFSLAGLYKAWKLKGKYTFLIYGFLASLMSIMVSAMWFDKLAGNSFGYRVTLDTIPFLVLLLTPAMPVILSRKALTVAFSILLAFSIFVQLVGYLSYDGGSWETRYIRTYENGKYEATHDNLWSLENNQLSWEIRNLHFYVSGPWQTGDYPSRDTSVKEIKAKEIKPGYVAIGVETYSPRIARMGITVYNPDTKEVVAELTPVLVPRGSFTRWTEPIFKDENSVELDIFISNIGAGDEHEIKATLDIETLLK